MHARKSRGLLMAEVPASYTVGSLVTFLSPFFLCVCMRVCGAFSVSEQAVQKMSKDLGQGCLIVLLNARLHQVEVFSKVSGQRVHQHPLPKE